MTAYTPETLNELADRLEHVSFQGCVAEIALIRAAADAWEADVTVGQALANSLMESNAALRVRLEAARLVAFQVQQSAAAIQNDPAKANAVSASWVIEVAGRILAALAKEETK